VKAWLEARGFGVEHRGANPGGDRGVDLVAMKGSGLDLVRLIVQCKCYRADRPIRPAIVRELAGVISTERTGTRGVIVTTSGWTAAADAAASEHGILLLTADQLSGATL
jgi:restriction system protein